MMEVAEGVNKFSYPIYLRYALRGSVPTIVAGLFLFSLFQGWTWDSLAFGVFCAAVALPWWWFYRRYGLTIIADSDGINFIRGRARTYARWATLSAVWFSTSGVHISANSRTWHVDSNLSNWDRLEKLLRHRACSEALMVRLTPPFRVRTKWIGLAQTGIFCTVLLVRGLNEITKGHWEIGVVIVGLGGFFLFLRRTAILWYCFWESRLVVQRLTRRENYMWVDLDCASANESVLTMSFAGKRPVAIAADEITRSPEDLFFSVKRFLT